MGCSDSKSAGTENSSSPKSAGKIELYEWPGSAPCRAVFLTAAAIGVPLDLHELNLIKGEQNEEAFKKINPNSKVPTLKEGDYILWESRAIMKYLCGKNKQGAAIYPTDPTKKAEVDRMLDYDQGTFYDAVAKWIYPQVLYQKEVGEEESTKLEEQMAMVDQMLSQKTYIAGDELTIADFSIYAGASLLWLKDYDYKKYSNIERWAKLIMELPYYKECNKGLVAWKEMVSGGAAKEEAPAEEAKPAEE